MEVDAARKKRKLRRAEEEREDRKPSKAPRTDRVEKDERKRGEDEKKLKEVKEEQVKPAENLEAAHPWRNLQLILSLQNKDIAIHKKVELAFNYVKFIQNGDDNNEDLETVSISRVIVFLNNWVQSLLISSEKKIRAEQYKPQPEIVGSLLDSRCWEIFKYCLEESLKLHVPLNVLRDFLRVIHCIARDILSRLDVVPVHAEEIIMTSSWFDIYSTVNHCVLLVFSSPIGVLNENLELWNLTAIAVLELVQRIIDHNLDGCNSGVLVLELACVVLEPFAKFLRIHPNKKNGFRDFVDKLLEPLLHLLNALCCRVHDSDPGWMQKLLKIIEEVLSHGLFHPAHMDGLLSLQSTGRYITLENRKPVDSSSTTKSYHRHLFDKLEKFWAGKNVLALSGIGEMFHVFVKFVKRQKGASLRGGLMSLENDFSGHMPKSSFENNKIVLEDNQFLSSLNAETRKSILDFFVQIVEPWLQELNLNLQGGPEVWPALVDFGSTLSSTNKIIVSFLHEELYIRTEDISEGAFFNFLKLIYDSLLSLSFKIIEKWSSTIDLDKPTEIGVLNSIAKELVHAVGCLIEIDYEVVGNDLKSLWFVIFSFAALGLSLPPAPDQHSVTTEILHLGRQLVNLYSELRQVNTVIFSLCDMARSLTLPNSHGEVIGSEFKSGAPVLYRGAYAKAVSMVLCAQEVRLAIYNAVVSISGGQVSGCIQQLKTDILESLEWIRDSCPFVARNELGKLDTSASKLYFDMQAELLGRGLCDMYTLVMDSLSVTAGNSNLLRFSMEELMTILRLKMKSLVAIDPGSVNKFFSTVTGRTQSDNKTERKNDFVSMHWILLFFFRLYMSCRSLYRQVLSLVPIDTSRRMSAAMCDSIAAFSGNDWLERTDWTCGGYFSWIIEPSASLVTVIQSISDIYLEDAAAADCSPLVYVLNAMAIQRLLDLNRLIKSFEYLLQKNEYLVQTRLIDDTGFSSNSQKPNSNNIRRWKECILSLRQEAADLTNFMMGHLLSLPKKQMSTPSYTNYKNLDIHTLPGYDTCHFVVGAINEKSLPSALLWIICQSIDVWCSHAAKKKLKLFLSLILRNFLLRVGSSSDEFAAQKPAKVSDLENIVAHEMSFELLKDTVFYEQRLVRRHMASRFCRILEKSVLAIFSNAGKVYSKSSPNWSEFLSMLDESLNFTGDNNLVMDESTSVAESASCYSKRQSIKCCREQKSRVPHILGFADCICLLNLLCWMPKGYLNSKSFSICATCIINMERLVVGSLLDCQDAVYWQNFHELLKLFLSCRRALKNLIIGCCEEMGAGQSSIAVILFQSSSPVLWLLKSLSAVFVAQQSYSEDSASQVKNVIFSLMDHTSNVLLAISKDQFILAVQCLVNGNPCEEENVGSVVNGAILHKGSTLVDSELSESTKNVDAWNTMVLVAETLKEQMDLLFSRINAECNTGMQTELGVIALNNLSAVVSCSQGFWWGLASALGQIDSDKCNVKTEVSRREHEPMLKLMCCIDAFAEFVNYYVHALLIEDDKCPDSFCDDQTRPLSDGVDDVPGVEESLWEDSGDVTENEHRSFGTLNSFSRSSDNKDHSGKKVRKKRSRSENSNSRDNMFSKCDSFELCRLKKSILQGFVRGEHPEAAFFLRELFIASSVLLRLNLQINCASLSLSSVPIFASIAQILLMEMEKEAKFSSPYSSVWFDGITKFFEELASHFPLSNPVLSKNAYVKMIELHLMAIGKCITLQGKRANLASHDTESRTKTLNLKMKLSGSTLSFGEYCLDGFKARLRMSFKAFIKTPSELHLLAALQALERALVGVRVGCTTNYEIFIGSSDGGKVSSLVAAGIDCMDLVLEFVTGRKRLNVVKRHIQNSVSCLFNIMLHLQGPSIFYRNIVSNKGNADPDPGSVILMCVEVLTRVVGKHDIYQLDSCQLGQSLRIPAVLFHNILQLRHSGAPDIYQWDNQDAKISDNKNFCDVDWEFSVDLYAACCRLLSTVIKHHKRECERCVALLEDSVSVLLHCLEMVNITASVRKQHFAWETLEAVKCASFLRRIYEELRQQKDVFGRHCSLFLSSYIWTYSGYGPLKNGIRREIDEALRPGVYALIDACSADDLQHLHTVFGEGPCRSTLATLQHDYKLNFQYEGKV